MLFFHFTDEVTKAQGGYVSHTCNYLVAEIGLKPMQSDLRVHSSEHSKLPGCLGKLAQEPEQACKNLNSHLYLSSRSALSKANC